MDRIFRRRRIEQENLIKIIKYANIDWYKNKRDICKEWLCLYPVSSTHIFSLLLFVAKRGYIQVLKYLFAEFFKHPLKYFSTVGSHSYHFYKTTYSDEITPQELQDYDYIVIAASCGRGHLNIIKCLLELHKNERVFVSKDGSPLYSDRQSHSLFSSLFSSVFFHCDQQLSIMKYILENSQEIYKKTLKHNIEKQYHFNIKYGHGYHNHLEEALLSACKAGNLCLFKYLVEKCSQMSLITHKMKINRAHLLTACKSLEPSAPDLIRYIHSQGIEFIDTNLKQAYQSCDPASRASIIELLKNEVDKTCLSTHEMGLSAFRKSPPL